MVVKINGKKFILIALGCFLFLFSLLGQEIIKNPKKPLNPRAGRIIRTQKIWQIGDEEGKFYFKSPYSLRIGADGTFFVADNEQLLKFSPDGHFLKNLYKKGQGPGEIESYFYYYLYEDRLYIYDPNAVKVIQLDLEGNLIHQCKLEKGPYNDFCGVNDRWLIFMDMIYPPFEERKGKLYDLPCLIKLISPDGSEEKEVYTFTSKTFLAPQAAAGWNPWQTLLSQDGQKLYVCRSREYLLEVLDIDKGQIIRRFNRDYPSIKHVEEDWEKEFRKRYDFPRIKYEIDIEELLLAGRLIWVKTSTTDNKKGDLFDVFDEQGQFIDSFYLGLKGRLLAIDNKFLYLLEKDEAENIFLSKYKIVE